MDRIVTDTMLEFQAVSYQWPGGSHSLGPINASVRRGQWVGLIGPNGSGKSTLLRLAAGYWKKSAGTILAQGSPVEHLPSHARARLMAHVPQSLETNFDLTVRDVVTLGRLNQLSWRERLGFGATDSRVIDRVLEETEMTRLADRSMTSLSGGEGRRALLAAALAQEAPLLLLDEPTAHLDPGHAIKFLNLVRSLVDRTQLTVLMAYHDLATVALYVDMLWVMNKGQLILSGTPDVILNEPVLRQIYDAELVSVLHPRTHRPMLIFP